MLLGVRFLARMCLIMAQMCLDSNHMCHGFTRHILIGRWAAIQKKCSILLCCLHLRPAADLISGLYTIGSSVFFFQFPDGASVTSIPRQIYNKCRNIFTLPLHFSCWLDEVPPKFNFFIFATSQFVGTLIYNIGTLQGFPYKATLHKISM